MHTVAFNATIFNSTVATTGIAMRTTDRRVFFVDDATGTWRELHDADAGNLHLHGQVPIGAGRRQRRWGPGREDQPHPAQGCVMQPPHSPEERFTNVLQSEVATLQATFPALAEALSRAQALVAAGAVFPEDSGREAMVRSSDGQRFYHVNGHCTCPASQYHREPCKHRLAFRLYQKVCDRLAPEDERWDIDHDVPVGQEGRQAPVIPPEGLVMIQSRPFIKFEALLALAHQRGLVSLETTVVQCSYDLTVCQSTARFQDGRCFVDIGDASPENVAKHLRPHFIRLAATRACARALRRALSVSLCSVEELSGREEEGGE